MRIIWLITVQLFIFYIFHIIFSVFQPFSVFINRRINVEKELYCIIIDLIIHITFMVNAIHSEILGNF